MHIKALTKSQGYIHVLNTGGGAIVFYLFIYLSLEGREG